MKAVTRPFLLPVFMTVLTLGVWSARHANADVVSTLPSWDGSSVAHYFGEGTTLTYGQTFTTNSTDLLLQQFHFDMRTTTAASSNFAGYVMLWDPINNRATGTVLFDSGARTNTNSPAQFNDIGFAPNLTLLPNTQYVLFISATNYADGTGDLAELGQPQKQDLYSGGSYVYINNSNFGQLTTTTWDGKNGGYLGAGVDLAFSVTTTLPVPEPGTWAMLLTGLGALGVARCSRRARQA